MIVTWFKPRNTTEVAETDDVPIDQLAYEQVTGALEQQSDVRNELRQRTSTLVAVTALVATFLGGQALRATPAGQGPRGVLLVGLAALCAGIGACLWVLVVTGMRKRKPETTQDVEQLAAAGGEAAHEQQRWLPRVRFRQRAAPWHRPRADDVVALMFSLNVEVLSTMPKREVWRCPTQRGCTQPGRCSCTGTRTLRSSRANNSRSTSRAWPSRYRLSAGSPS